MAPVPIVVDHAAPLAQAHQLMRDYQIRHLPVMSGEELVGLVSMSDLHLMETLKDVDPDTVPVSEAMSKELYKVEPDTELRIVALNMYSRKLGSALVVKDDKLVGLFTTVDALRVLAHMQE